MLTVDIEISLSGFFIFTFFEGLYCGLDSWANTTFFSVNAYLKLLWSTVLNLFVTSMSEQYNNVEKMIESRANSDFAVVFYSIES